MAKITLKAINARIATIGNGELSFKQEMGTVSRDILVYIRENGDIDAVNRLMAVLSPINKEKTKQYFNHFLPYTWEMKASRFGSKSKNKDVVTKKEKLADEFLADKAANIWTWIADQNSAEPVAKPKEYEKKIEALVKKAIEDKEEHIPVSTIIRAVIKAGASLSEIMAALMPSADGEEPSNTEANNDVAVPRKEAKAA